MKNLFNLKLEKDWVNKGDYQFSLSKDVKVYAETFAEAYIQLTIFFGINESAQFITIRKDTEITCSEKDIETTSVIPVENIGENLENLFSIIHDVLASIHPIEEKTCE